MKKTFLALLVLAILACGHLNQNFVKKGIFSFDGGKYKGQTWSDQLTFDRYTWYRQISMMYDLLWYKVDPTSPFYVWFSDNEKQKISECARFYVTVIYSYVANNGGISHREFYDQMALNQLEEYALVDFNRELRSHPEYTRWVMKSHKVTGFCDRGTTNEPILIQFPSQDRLSIAR